MGNTKSSLHTAASLLTLIGLAPVVIGLQTTALLWQIGLGVVGLAMILSLLSRWAGEAQEEEPKGRHAYEERGDGRRGR